MTTIPSHPSRARPVRLELMDVDHKRLEENAAKLGLSKAALSRMIVLAWLNRSDDRKRKTL